MSEVIIPKIFLPYSELICGLSTKVFGNLRSLNKLDKSEAAANQKKFAKILGFKTSQLAIAGLEHGANVCLVKKEEAGKIFKNCDAILTNNKGVFLMVTVADCLPIFIYDYKKKICGIIHAGWRSLTEKIIRQTIKKLIVSFDSSPSDLLVFIGPGIGPCHFEIKDDVVKLFPKEYILEKNGKIFADLKGLALFQLLSEGVNEENIEVSSECTFCKINKYFSYRRDRPKNIEGMGAVIGRK